MTFVHHRTVEIAWGDCDPAGIVFHPRYLDWFDAAAAALFAAATGMNKAAMVEHHGIVGIPVVELGATFHSPCRYGDMAVIASQVETWKRSSFTLLHELRVGDRLAVTGRSTRVWAGRDPGEPGRIRAVPLPPELIAAFQNKENSEDTPCNAEPC